MRYRPLLSAALLLSACSSGEMNLEVESLLTDTEDPLYSHAQLYLSAHQLFDNVIAELSCPAEGSTACLLRIDASHQVYEGAESALVLYVATGVQPLPGTVDLSGVYQYDVEPVSYATVEEVGYDDLSRRYDYVCTYDSGTLTLKSAPAIGEVLEGQLDLTVACTERLYPSETVPAQLTGTFSTTVDERPY